MKRKTGKGSAWVTGLLVLVALALALWPAEGRTACARTAAEICLSVTSTDTTDCDEDGFSDYLECTTGFNTAKTPVNHYYGYYQSGRPDVRDSYLDPTGKDLFVYVAPDTNTKIKQADLDSVKATLLSQLGVVVHYISSTDFVSGSIRQVTTSSPQKGLWISENSGTTTGADCTTLGYTYPLAQTPDNNSLSVTVYTGRLQSYVGTTVCPVASYPKCVDSTGVGRQNSTDTTGLANLYSIYHRQNIIHELSHAISLANTTGSHHGVNTTSPFNNSIMSQYVFSKAYAETKKPVEPKKQVFYIPFIYDPSDKAAVRLMYK